MSDFSRSCRTQAQRMARLIDDLLSLSRIELNAHLRPDKEIDLVGIVHEVVDGLQTLAVERAVEITIAAPSRPIRVLGERDELMRLCENLVENALKYAASGKRVEIEMSRSAPGQGNGRLPPPGQGSRSSLGTGPPCRGACGSRPGCGGRRNSASPNTSEAGLHRGSRSRAPDPGGTVRGGERGSRRQRPGPPGMGRSGPTLPRRIWRVRSGATILTS